MFSIIIPTLNNLNHLKLCIDSIKKNSALKNEIIIHVSMGNDGTREYLKEQNINHTFTDYNAGTNHVLPTMGSARFSSGLNVGDFYKKISYINLSKKGIEVIGKQAITLAEYESLEGHAQSIKSRIRRN